ncbi:MAG: hypothetical protein JNM72_21945 [Deltaproteobacteria bacterium]|nr:hypothetical protein [Deltaproteobacteria bacterium]
MARTTALLLTTLAACEGQKAVEGAECSEAEQDLFLACVDAGCSASYTEDLGATDACAVDGGGSIITVEAGASCGFTSSGSCFVLCDCPEGVGVEVEVGQSQGDDQDLSTIESAVQAVEDAIGALTEEQSSSGTEVAALAERLAALEAAHAAEVAAREAENAALRAELDAANEQLAEVDARTAGTLVVSEYEIYCTEDSGSVEGPTEWTRPYVFQYLDGHTREEHCIVAQIDPDDRPYLIVIEVRSDNRLEYPPYSSADSLARYGFDDPGQYSELTSFGNDLAYTLRTAPFGQAEWITASGDVVMTKTQTTQNDRTDPEGPVGVNLPVRVTIFHDRPYSAPVYP